MAEKKLFLIDGSALAYRSHFAYARSPLRTSTGLPTGAVFGFTQALLRLLDKEKPDHLAVAFDTPEPTFRHKKFKPYKATREKMEADLIDQLPVIKSVLQAYRVPVIERPGYEADDVIGTLAKAGEQSSYDVFIVTGDKDFMQLVTPKIKLYNLFKKDVDVEIIDAKGVHEKFGVAPEQVIEVLAIMGDASDNIPGIKGIGEKGAIQLIQQFGSLENCIANVEKIEKAKLKLLVTEQVEQARLSHDLVTIDTKVPLDFGPNDLAVQEPNREKLQELFTELEFTSLLKKVAGTAGSAKKNYRIVRTPEELAHLQKQLKNSSGFVFDTETTGLDPLRVDIVGFSFAWQEKYAYYVPFNLFPPLLPGGIKELLKAFRPILEDAHIPKWGQNMKYDALVLAAHDIHLQPMAFDTMLASYSLMPAGREHNLDALALYYLNYQKIPTTDLLGTGRKQITMDQVPIDRVGEYACEDADITLRLKTILQRELADKPAKKLFEEIEMPLVPVLTAMEKYGVKIDAALLNAQAKDLKKRTLKLTEEIHALAGEAFNINSNRQLGIILFEKLQIHKLKNSKRVKRTKTGYATDAGTLEFYADVPIVEKLLEYRRYTKLINTYLEALPALVNPKTGRVHTSFAQTIAATGRLSSIDPNLQNIPIRTEVGREIRKAFVAGHAGWKILSADYSQIELRLVAHLANDPRLVNAFREDRDIHRETAALVFGLDPDQVTSALRSRAKAINFGIIYGMGPQRLARETGMSLEEAKTFIETYFHTFPKVREFLDRILAEARVSGYVQTLYGRRRPVPELDSMNPGVRANAENIAVNTPIQGSAADLIKLAMIRIHHKFNQMQWKSAMILQVHDELVFEVAPDELTAVQEIVRNEMENVVKLNVPLKVEQGVGNNWLEAH